MFTRYNTQKPVTGIQVNRRHSLSRGLVGCWLFNEGSGDKVFDLSGNNRGGTLSGDVTWGAGKFGVATYFGGTNGNIYIPAMTKTVLGSNFSIVIHFKSTTSQNNSLVNIAATHDSGSPWIFGQLYTVDSRLSWYLNGSYRINQTITDNVDYVVILTYDGITWRAYKNGVADGTYVGAVGTNAGTYTWLGDGFFDYMIGIIDFAYFYNRTLSASEIALLYRETFCMFESDPIELWSATALAPPVGMAGAMTTNTGYWGW